MKSIGVHDPFAFKGSPSEPLSTGWQYVGPKGQPGRMQALAIDIDNSKNILAGAATGGVWRSIDGGESWVKVTPVNEVQTVSCIVQDTRPGKHSIWYYGTSELLSTTDRPHTSNIRTHMGGNGIYRSIDNGATWDPLPSTQTRDGDTAAINFQGIWNIVIDHHTFDKDILYAACFGGIMRSINGGATWTKTLGSDTDMCFNSEITIGTNGTIYAALSSNYTGIPSPKQGIWWSNDGINWVRMLHTSIPTLWRRMKLAVAPSHDSILYIFAEGPKDWSIPDYTFASYHTLLKCGRRANGNIQWSDFSGKVLDLGEEPGQFSTLTGYAMVLAVHPYDSNFVLFGGTNLYRSFVGLFDEDLYHSIGGYPYDFEPGALHPDMHAALFDPSNPEKLFVATDGGIYSTDDPREDSTFWQQYYEGLGTSQVYDAKLDVTASGDDFIISGLQDNSSYVAFDHDAWAIASGGDGMTTGFADGKDLFVTSLQTGYMFFFGYDGISFYYYGIATINDEQSYFPFFTKFVIDHNTGNELYYASGQDLWVLPSLLSIPIDLQVDNGLWQQFQFVGESIGVENEISALALSTGSFPTLYMGTNNGMLFTIDAGEQSVFDVPKVITSPLFPSNGYLAHIEVDPHNESNIIVVFSNYGVQSIFSTTNGGTSWRPVSGNLEQTLDGSGAGPSVRTVRILHTPTGIVYLAGTTSGLFSTYTLDGMNTVWTREAVTTIGVLIVESIDVRESDGRVIAATQGGGIFSGNYQSLGTASVSVPRQLIIEQNYPNPVTDLTTIRYTLPESGNATLVLYDVLGKKIATLFEGTQEKGTHLFSFTPKSISTGISAGVYFYSLRCGGTTVTKMMEVVN
ncbi:MAG TPA: T9SS type A sorting domain-containing protein [Candidatus Kapabacteria bacterium]